MPVCVESSARLHLGFYNFFEDGVAYGGLGVGIELPRIRVRVGLGRGLRVVSAVEGLYVGDVVEAVTRGLGVGGLSIEIAEAYPRHVGLGSTTQLALSIGYGVSRLLNLGYSVRELAVMLGRGRDSGIGIAVFEHGGFVVDSGRRVRDGVTPPKSVEDLPHTLFRSPLPEDWHFVVVVPRRARGLDEVRERSAMDHPRGLPRDLQYELYKLVLLHIIPSVVRGDAETFGRALTKLQLIVGSYFSKYQGGVFCCEEVEEVAKALIESGAYGVGQSSWGPTVYGVAGCRDHAERVANGVLKRIERLGEEYSHYVVRARNAGARAFDC